MTHHLLRAQSTYKDIRMLISSHTHKLAPSLTHTLTLTLSHTHTHAYAHTHTTNTCITGDGLVQ